MYKEQAEALIGRFGVRRIAGTPSPATPASPATDLIARRERLDGGILYLRPGRVDAGLPAALRSALTDSAWTTNASGLILDLRFAPGDSLPAAGDSAALFSERTASTLQRGSGSASGAGSQRLWRMLHRPVDQLADSRNAAWQACRRALRAARR